MVCITLISLLFYATIAKRRRSVPCMDTPPVSRGIETVGEKHKTLFYCYFLREERYVGGDSF